MCISPTQNELEQKNNSNNTDNDDDSSSNDKINNKNNNNKNKQQQQTIFAYGSRRCSTGLVWYCVLPRISMAWWQKPVPETSNANAMWQWPQPWHNRPPSQESGGLEVPEDIVRMVNAVRPVCGFFKRGWCKKGPKSGCFCVAFIASYCFLESEPTNQKNVEAWKKYKSKI